MDWLTLLTFAVSNILAFFIGWQFAERMEEEHHQANARASLEWLHRRMVALEAALEEARCGAPIEQTDHGVRVGGIEITPVNGSHGRLPVGAMRTRTADPPEERWP